jgi:ATP-binding cassette subfamily B protein
MLPSVAKLIWDACPRLVAAEVALRVVAAAIPVAMLWVTKLIIDQVTAAVGVPGPLSSGLWLLLGAEFGLATLAILVGRATDYCDGRIADEFSRKISARVIEHSIQMDLAHFEDSAFQDLLERARLQATDRTEMLSDLGRLAQETVTLLSLCAGAAWYAPGLLVLVLLCMIPAFLAESHYAFASYTLANEMTPLRRQLDYLRELCTSRQSIKEVKLFQLGGFLNGRFDAITTDLLHRNDNLARRRLVAGSAFAVLGSLGYYAAHVVIVASAMRGAITVGTLTFLSGSLATSSAKIQVVFSLLSKIAQEFLFLSDLFTFLAMPASATKSRGDVATLPVKLGAGRGLEFRNVSFSYSGADREILHDISFRIGPTERVALVGTNGQGKTTLVKLMARLYEPTSGTIYLDGINIQEIPHEALWSRIGIIFQDFVKYEMTAAENIAVGRIRQVAQTDDLARAAVQSGAEEILERLPLGLEQMLGRRFNGGVDLSGGEWQRFALARAYLRRADILVLDEPTAALDAKAEHEVFERFAELSEERMVLLISHRFSTVRMATRILVLDGGSIREEGTHDEFLAQGGRYAEMFELQAANYR